MLQLPVELRRFCLEALEHLQDDEDDYYSHHDTCSEALKALRLVNREIGTLATEQLFRTTVLNVSDGSADKFVNLLLHPHRSLVHRVIINTSENPNHSLYDEDEAEFQGRFKETIPLIKDFEHLQEIELRFTRECGMDVDRSYLPLGISETASFRVKVLETCFGALKQASSVQSLTIKNLQDYHDPAFFESDMFVAVRNALSKLHLQIATEDDEASPDRTIEKPALHEFFMGSLPNIWLKPLTSQLTHLTLYATRCRWGLVPFVDFRRIPVFPKLKSLSFGNLTIAHWQIDWITAHGNSLEELYLDDCMIITAMQFDLDKANLDHAGVVFSESERRAWVPHIGTRRGRSPARFARMDLRWHQVFQRFQLELLRLQHIAFGSGDWDNGTAFDSRYNLGNTIQQRRYGMFDCGNWVVMGSRYNKHGHKFMIKHREWIEEPEPDCLADDVDALTSLMQVVRSREGTRM